MVVQNCGGSAELRSCMMSCKKWWIWQFKNIEIECLPIIIYTSLRTLSTIYNISDSPLSWRLLALQSKGGCGLRSGVVLPILLVAFLIGLVERLQYCWFWRGREKKNQWLVVIECAPSWLESSSYISSYSSLRSGNQFSAWNTNSWLAYRYWCCVSLYWGEN